MRKIELTRGFEAQIDDEDFAHLSQYKWFAHGISRFKKGGKIYAGTSIKGKTVHMHRMLAGKPGSIVDHADGDGLNNTRKNLRSCLYSQNLMNSRKIKNCASEFKGVSPHPYGWTSKITKHGKTYYLGIFKSEKAAAITYNRAARKMFKEFAHLNKIGIHA